MEGTIMNFRRGRRTVSGNQMIIKVSSVDSREKARSLVGKTISWKSPAGKEINGKISSPHGNGGAIRAIFETGMPGQAITTKVSIK